MGDILGGVQRKMISAPTENGKKVLTMAEYIERELAIEALSRGEGCGNVCRRAIERILAADVAPVVHGQWISLTECSNAGVYCSICHKKVYKEDYAWCNRKNKVRSSYCPNCGAKMDGGAENG